MNPIITVGITGGIGTGKSVVCRILSIMGYPVFYSDKVSKELLDTNPEAVEKITELFGPLAYENHRLNRTYISERVFENPQLLQTLNSIAHPLVRQAFIQWTHHQNSRVVFNEAAILFETGSYQNFQFNVLITAPEPLKIKRVQLRDGLSTAQIQARMKNQWPDERKSALANFIIQNDEQHALIPQIQEMLISVGV